ncbi:WD40 repeat domain-containing protein [Halarcobacter sp.]|uniref:WD40 repeat domain-containing protein n=1 Tax=Halarcobacter sp. TaxID=2321133 RepID=UPI002AA915FD|nr:WD40 repeat domain-containing protein [Halarcobacter sp.]
MLKLLLLFTFIINLNAIEKLEPKNTFITTGDVQDIKIKNNLLYAATSNGTVEIYNINTKEKEKTIKIPNIKDFMGDLIASKIYSIDLIKNKILIVAQGMKGYRNIYIYENNNLKKIIDINKKFYVQKAYFVDNDKIIFALLSNQIALYNINTKKLKYLIQISASSFSDFIISEDKNELATTDESGIVRKLNIKNGKVIKQFKALNLDKVYQLDYKNNTIITAGQDRKASIYTPQSSYKLDFDFLLYSCALSSDAKLGAIAFNEKNDVLIFNTYTKEYLYNLTGQDATVTKILFKTNKEIFISSDSNKINHFYFKGVKK